MKQGFTLLEIMIVVAIIGILAALSIPSFMVARAQSQANSCINNLRQIEAGKAQWSLVQKRNTGDPVVTSEVMAYVKNPEATTNCPAGGTVIFGAVGTNASCTVEGRFPHQLTN